MPKLKKISKIGQSECTIRLKMRQETKKILKNRERENWGKSSANLEIKLGNFKEGFSFLSRKESVNVVGKGGEL